MAGLGGGLTWGHSVLWLFAARAFGGIATANLAGSPLIAVSGSRPRAFADRQAFQDIDQVGMARPVVKWAAEVPDASQIPFYLARAFAEATAGRNGAVHGGCLGMLFDTVLGLTSSVLTGGPRQRTAYLHINYRQIVPIEKKLDIDARVDRVEGRKIFVSGRLRDGDAVLTDAEALFVLLKPGQP